MYFFRFIFRLVFVLIVFLSLFKAKELQTLHNLRKLFVQDLATRVKKVKWQDLMFFCLGSQKGRTHNRNAVWVTEAAKSGGLPEEITQSLLVLLLLIPVFFLFCRALRWTLMTQGAALHKSRKYPFLRTILSSSPRFTNR